MTESPIPVSAGKTLYALDELRAFVDERRCARGPVADFESFEREARRRFAAAQAEFVAEELVRRDVDAPAVEIDGVAQRRVLCCAQTYMTASGPSPSSGRRTRPARTTSAPSARWSCGRGSSRATSHHWPRRTRRGRSHLTPGESEALSARMGGMSPSKSTLDRLPKALSERWEADRVGFEQRLRAEESPEERRGCRGPADTR